MTTLTDRLKGSLPLEKIAVLQAIEAGKNVCITGCAGTGKTFLLQLLKEHYLSNNLHITASTGIAAVHVGGTTLHSFAALGTGVLPAEEILRFLNSKQASRIRRKLKQTRMLAIDEISMISAELFDKLDFILREIRGKNLPFGGIQLILFGDFLQLPPINSANQREEVHFCFESQAWQEGNIEVFVLKQVFRQDNQRFIDLLSRLRTASLTEEDLALLESRKQYPPEEGVRPTLLVTHNRHAEEMNRRMLEGLSDEARLFTMKASGNENKIAFLKKNCLAPEQLVLKKGSQVMMLKNSLQKEGIINGSLGIVVDFSREGSPMVTFTNGKTLVIGPESWTAEEFDPITHSMIVHATITQIPLLLAWAITVHKSQGMTLDKVECDLGQAFEEGQVYVALSRVKQLEGLYLRSFNPRRIGANPKVVAFYREVEESERARMQEETPLLCL